MSDRLAPADYAAMDARETLYKSQVRKLREYCLSQVPDDPRLSFLRDVFREAHTFDKLVGEMRLIKGGQLMAMKYLKSIDPHVTWFRGGYAVQFIDQMGKASIPYFTQEELETIIPDMGANGILARRGVAQGFKDLKGPGAVMFHASIDDLIAGLEDDSIQLVPEHDYDLCIRRVSDTKKYLSWCRAHLQVESGPKPRLN